MCMYMYVYVIYSPMTCIHVHVCVEIGNTVPMIIFIQHPFFFLKWGGGGGGGELSNSLSEMCILLMYTCMIILGNSIERSSLWI